MSTSHCNTSKRYKRTTYERQDRSISNRISYRRESNEQL